MSCPGVECSSTCESACPTAAPSPASSASSLPTPQDQREAFPLEAAGTGGDYGWFSDVDECLDYGAEAIQRRQKEIPRQRDDCVYRADRPGFLVSTKCFGGKTFAWGIGGFRIVRGSAGSRHAEFQVLARYGDTSWAAWIRWTEFEQKLAEGPAKHWHRAACCWCDVKANQPWYRCLNTEYLRRKCLLLEGYLSQVLFDAPEVNQLLEFVASSAQPAAFC
ncbi:hypothetical protein JKP88DRAFT_263108 [Tribonema minus]|uniref:Uncharacterized protein n=1 Tax=Tribonema minus TaxID=303371 RepID=A0A835YXN3_9STRA|nr:hypothetical protein JKP88DRAFT_263108 [Tribonema minus]